MNNLETMFPNMEQINVSWSKDIDNFYKKGMVNIDEVVSINKRMVRDKIKTCHYVDICMADFIIENLISKATTIGDKLSLVEAMRFIKEYSVTQLKKKEYCITIYDLENLYRRKSVISYIWKRCYTDSMCLGSTLPRNKKQCANSLIPLIKNKRNILYKNSCREVLASKIFIYADNIIEDLFKTYLVCTKEMIMRRFDAILAHERHHLHMERYYSTPYDYIKKHWRTIYNYSSYDIKEQCCNRAGFLNMIKQIHKRRKENEVSQ